MTISVMVTFDITFEGCCRPDGMCGFDLGLIGIGCMEREETAMTPIMGMLLPDAGMIMSISCGDSGDDAGNDDVDAGR